jgi:VanZ family protein
MQGCGRSCEAGANRQGYRHLTDSRAPGRSMKLNRRTLHAARIADAILFWPVLLAVIVAELYTFETAARLVPFDDQVIHFTAYFVLGAMAAAAFKSRWPVVYAVLGLIALGGILEIIQDFVGRERSFWDQVANTAGALSCGIAGRVVIEPLRRRYASEAISGGISKGEM